MGIDFTPNIGTTSGQGNFRFWCQKVLPLVYDDSLSYYELLCKVVDYLNKAMEDVNTLSGDVRSIYTAYTQLQDWVNHYFDNLDIQNEVNKKIDLMVEDGTLDAIINTQLFADLNERINKNSSDITSLETTTYNVGKESVGVEVILNNILSVTKVNYNGDGVKKKLTLCVVGDSTTAVYDVLDINHWTNIIKNRLSKYFDLTFYNYALGNRNLGQFLDSDYLFPNTNKSWKNVVIDCSADIYLGMWGVNEAYDNPQCSHNYSVNLLSFYNTLKKENNDVILATPININVDNEAVVNKEQNNNINNISWVLRNTLIDKNVIDINALTNCVVSGKNVYQVDIPNIYTNNLPKTKFLNFSVNFDLTNHAWYPFTNLTKYSTFIFRRYRKNGALIDSYSRITFGLNDDGEKCCRYECSDGVNTFTSENYVITNPQLVNFSIVGGYIIIDGREIRNDINIYPGYVNRLNCGDVNYEIFVYEPHSVSDNPLGFNYFVGSGDVNELLNGNGFTHPSINGQMILCSGFNKFVDYLITKN